MIYINGEISFDNITVKFWKTNPGPVTFGRGLSLDKDGGAPRHTY